MTAAQIVRQAGYGTPAGVRRALNRLVIDGLVDSKYLGDLATYSLNHDHILYPAVEPLLDAHRALTSRLRRDLREWDPAPSFGALFGSAAQGGSDEDSDVDVLLLQPTMTAVERRRWNEEVHRLRKSIRAWTGNHADITDLRPAELRALARQRAPIIESWRQHLVVLAGEEPDVLAV